jgi:hypothetical protein
MLGSSVNRLGVTNTNQFNPSVLFAQGEEGAWYDPSDLSSMFQADQTTPAVQGQAVGKILDKSGNGHHLVQTNSDKCPILRVDDLGNFCLDFTTDDGMRSTDDFLFADNNVTDMSLFAGCRKESSGINQTIMELSNNLGSQKGCFRILCTSGELWRVIQKGGFGDGETAVANTLQSSSVGTPNRSVLSSIASITAPSHSFKRNGAVVNSNTGSLGTGTFGNHVLNVGARSNGLSANLDGKIYGIIVRGALTDADTRIKVDKYLGFKSGVSI